MVQRGSALHLATGDQHHIILPLRKRPNSFDYAIREGIEDAPSGGVLNLLYSTDLERRLRTASASWAIKGTVSSQAMQLSVML